MAWANQRLGRTDRTKPAPIDEDTAAQFKAWGVKFEAEVTAEEDFVRIASANWPSLMAFLACDTQWRVAGSMGGYMWVGLDFAGCAARLAHRETSAQLFDDLSVMEDAALAVMNSGDE